MVIDPLYGFRRLDPLPDENFLESFYAHKYYDSLVGRAPDLQRQQSGGPEAQRDERWLTHTLWGDIVDTLDRCLPARKNRLDYGSGLGNFARYMRSGLWEVMGIEPASWTMNVQAGVPIFRNLADLPEGKFRVSTLLNVF